MRRFSIIIVILGLLHGAGAAQLSADLSPPTAHIGDTLQYILQVEGAAGKPVVFTPPGDDFTLLTIDSSRIQSEQKVVFTVAVYDTGTHLLSDLPVIVGHGAEAETLRTPPVSVTIQSLLPDTAQSVLPIKPYREHPFQARELLAYWWIPALIALGAGAWWLVRRYRRRQKESGSEYVVPLLPPDDEAARALIALRDNKYPERGMLKEFFSEYSYIMRRYLERRYEFPALEMTTFDLSRELEGSEYADCLTKRLLPTLSEADLVKFAKYLPDFNQCNGYIDLGFELIDLTKPRIEEAEPEAQAA